MVIVGTRLGAFALLVAAHSAMGCNAAASDAASEHTSSKPASAKSSSTPVSPHSSSSTSPGTSSSSSTSANASAAPTSHSPLAGKWIASFEAKKAKVAQDPGVADPAWAKDDGSQVSGAGTIEITVAEDGTVSGKLSGSLGDGIITGMAEEKGVTGTFTPASTEASAMHGTFVLELASDKLTGTLRASSGDARVVRSAALSFSREK